MYSSHFCGPCGTYVRMYSSAVPGVDEQRGRDKRADVQHVGGELEPRTRSALPYAGARRQSRR